VRAASLLRISRRLSSGPWPPVLGDWASARSALGIRTHAPAIVLPRHSCAAAVGRRPERVRRWTVTS